MNHSAPSFQCQPVDFGASFSHEQRRLCRKLTWCQKAAKFTFVSMSRLFDASIAASIDLTANVPLVGQLMELVCLFVCYYNCDPDQRRWRSVSVSLLYPYRSFCHNRNLQFWIILPCLILWSLCFYMRGSMRLCFQPSVASRLKPRIQSPPPLYRTLPGDFPLLSRSIAQIDPCIEDQLMEIWRRGTEGELAAAQSCQLGQHDSFSLNKCGISEMSIKYN